MKLRNKRTGIVIEWFNNTDGVFPNTLAELNEEWEDYKEPKKYWYITGEGDICRDDVKCSEWIEERKSIGNHFETEEETDKAVKKLKAWKRLKENGFSFESWDGYVDTGNEFDSGDHFECCGFVNARGKFLKSFDKYTQFKADLDLLFGGEDGRN